MMSKRYDVEPFTDRHLEAAARLLAERHDRQRREWPALDPTWEQPGRARELVSGLFDQDGASGALASADGLAVAFVLGVRRSDDIWGPNVWVEDAGNAGFDPEALRESYALAARMWVEEGRTRHYAVVPATDGPMIDAWFSLSFGLQHVHALRSAPPADFRPGGMPNMEVRSPTRADLPAMAELDLVLPRHQAGSAVFSRQAVPSQDETLAELDAGFDDPRFATFVAEQNGRVVATAVGCALELSSTNTTMMRPPSAGFLGYAAVLPDARGLGAGRAVAEAVMAWSRDEGYEWVATDWRSTNLEANRSWRALGFQPTFLRLHRAIA